MTASETIEFKSGAFTARVSTRGIARRRIAGAIATVALGLVILASGPIGQGKPVGAAETRATTNFAVAEPPTDASNSTTYRWNFEVYPSR